MSGLSGLVFPAATIGLGSLLIRPRRGFFPPNPEVGPPDQIVPQVTLEERHTDELEITEHPVEQGAAIADHAYKRPAEVVIQCAWSNSRPAASGLFSTAVGIGAAFNRAIGIAASIPQTAAAAQSVFKGNDANQVNQIYSRLLRLQESRIPFDILTAKRSYTNMLFKTLTVITDPENENNLMLTAVCRQIIIVRTQVVTFNSDPATQADPEKTQPPQDQGPQQLQDATSYSPVATTLSGSLGFLTGGATQMLETLTAIPAGIMESLSGPIAQLPTSLTSMMDSVNGVLSQLPLPLNIPLVGGPQKLSLPFTGIDWESALGTAVKLLPTDLQTTQSTLIAAAKQLPSISSVFDPATSLALKVGLEGMQGLVDGSLTQLNRVIPS